MQTERTDHAGFLGGEDQIERRDLGPSDRAARERLEPANAAGPELDDRLVVHGQQRLLDRAA